MSLSTAQTLVLSNIQHQYNTLSSDEKEVPVTRRSSGRKAVNASARTLPAIPAAKREHIALISARDFVIGMRRARDRSEKIALIDKYVGFNPAQDFGTQELIALRKANNSINPPRMAGAYSLQANGGSFVSGMPKQQEKEIQDLEARERLAVETMLDFEKKALDCEDSNVASVYHAQAELETQRVIEIRRDLARLRNRV